ncbi:RagB/SusD family nutrient uptake outer membrane protein [Pseudobacter ginsenosidimutans]|uniref:SusD-like starch-binding protein associating with outer membrane n=1 Tax=Pseudobacter ginsenosidimutans TaxID=661488 RepID=A0A4V2F089_9BACT|nr:RagB/SusD family nutrient uptake outer membrane protein [Pseudobacter ginsenosidimutans]QEC40251.1 RagB/SusD family nutrient uptake outer membrane protein [Pseudobacter ginsenosidimutans]RZS69150.1 SusD-like starch-binding protein associating with outer membrane [Pseudobacter ginsenosidimutans]
MKKKIQFVTIALISLLVSSCSKGWLEEKQNIKLIVPTTLNDLDLLMNSSEFEYDGRGAAETSCDDYNFTPEQLSLFYYNSDRDFITWKKERDLEYGSSQLNEWVAAYIQVQICNVVLEGLETINRTEKNKAIYDRLKGCALFYRSRQFLNIAMDFCKYYDADTAPADLGIPLKLTADKDEKIVRASLEATYQQIVTDLETASKLLPVEQIIRSQVARGGAYALLARAYLFMDRYQAAQKSADSSLKYHSYVEDFNLVNNTGTRPLVIESKEMHLRFSAMTRSSSNPTYGRIADDLYDLYENTDLRKSLFFRKETDNKYSFRGSYSGQLFTGTTTAEVLLILAETKARLGDPDGAMDALNILLSKRYISQSFVPLTAQNQKEALDRILAERRKELVTRGIRWQDLKRLNRDPQYAKTLTRTIGSETYNLPPNDPRYVLPIPQFVINYNGITQNQY